MADAGCLDILVSFNIVGAAKLERLQRLLGRIRLAVSVDDAALLPGLADAAAHAGRELGVLVDCDTGLGRTGVSDPEAAAPCTRPSSAVQGGTVPSSTRPPRRSRPTRAPTRASDCCSRRRARTS
jgi:D-serine deaminase-like pyridoxal phosphate-dependent protein